MITYLAPGDIRISLSSWNPIHCFPEYINQTHHSSVLASSCFSMCIDVIVDLFQGPPSKRHHIGGYLHLNHMPGMRGSNTLNFSGQSPWADLGMWLEFIHLPPLSEPRKHLIHDTIQSHQHACLDRSSLQIHLHKYAYKKSNQMISGPGSLFPSPNAPKQVGFKPSPGACCAWSPNP